MKKTELRKIIKEEIKSTLNEGSVVLIGDWIRDNKNHLDALNHWISLIKKFDQPELVEETRGVFNKLVEAEKSLKILDSAMWDFYDGLDKVPPKI